MSNGTMRPGNPGGTIRGGNMPNQGNTTNADNLETVDLENQDLETIDAPTPQGGTVRPNASSGTMRPGAQGGAQGGTQRPQQGGTMRPGAQGGTQRPQQGGTMRPNTQGGTQRPQQSNAPQQVEEIQQEAQQNAGPVDLNKKSAAPRDKKEGANVKVLSRDQQDNSFKKVTLNGITYDVDAVISASTGEAEIYKVSKGGRQYALKLYYPTYNAEPKVLEILKSISGTGVLVDLLDYGEWVSPQGDIRQFELMPFYTGGELKPGTMHGKADELKVAAVGMMLALKTAHDHNILHKDIKPNNYFYADESHAQLVLADFGIASAFQRDSKGVMVPLMARVQFRTKIYAAPEIYTMIDGEVEYSDEKSDYYSLGMALLTLWIGEKPFEGYKEIALLRLKKGETGTLPYPDDMPANLLQLIKGLTIVNPNKRWGFDEFERWAKGEMVDVDETSSQVSSDLNILYNGSKNQVAHTAEQLAQYMMEDTKLAASYLYSGKIGKWFADAGYPEVQIELDEIVNKSYPKNQHSGVLAACYILDRSLPFYGMEKQPLNSEEEIAQDILNHMGEYRESLSSPDAPLYIYLEANGAKAREKFLPMFQKNSWSAIWRLLYTIYPDAPFPFYLTNKQDVAYAYTIEELVNLFEQAPLEDYEGMDLNETTDDNYTPFLLYDDAFITWLSARDEVMAGKIKSIIPNNPWDKKELFYLIMYMMDPTRNYDYKRDQNHNFTIAQLSETFNQQYLDDKVLGKKIYRGFFDLDMKNRGRDTRLGYYLQSKGLYKDKFDYLEYCFEIDSNDRERQAGPYDIDIAYFKAIKALGNDSFYEFPRSGKKVHTIDELDKVSDDEKLDQLRNGKLKAWLAVQYQEDPFADLSEQYAYESLLMQYTGKIGEIDTDNENVVRFMEASDEVEDNAKLIHRKLNSIKLARILEWLLVLAPLGIMAICYLIWGIVDNYSPKASLWSLIIFPTIALAIPIRFLEMFPVLSESIPNTFGEKFGWWLQDHKWITAVLIALVPSLVFFGLQQLHTPYAAWMMAAVCLITMGVQAYCIFVKNRTYAANWDNAINPDEEATCVEPLYYAWKDAGSTNKFESETLDDQATYLNGIRDVQKDTWIKLFKGIIYTALLAIVFVSLWTPTSDYIANKFNKHVHHEAVTNSHDRYYADVKTSLTIRQAPSASSAALGSFKRGEEFDVISINNGFAKIEYNGQEAYVNAKYIKKVKSQDSANTSTDSGKTTNKSSSSSSSKSEKNESSVSQGDNTEVETSASPAPVAPSASNVYRVMQVGYLPVYSRTSTVLDYIIGELKPGTEIKVLGTSGQFSQINYEGNNAYVETKYIEKVN